MTPLLPVAVVGTGSYAPKEVLSNQHYIDYLDTTEEWIISRTGIRERRRAASDETCSTLAVEACKRALASAGLGAGDVDVIICATATPDCPFPATAAFIHAGLGAREVAAFDISAACAGFLYGAIMASSLISTGVYQRALVVGAEVLTRFADPQDRTTVVLFGDAAGAAVLARTAAPNQGVLYHETGCDGTRAQHIWVPAGGSRLPAAENTVAERLHYMRMKGREVYKFAVLKMQELIDRALQVTGLTPDDLAMVIPHQSNLRIIESVREKLRLPPEKVSVTIDRYGNTSAASVPVALDEARRAGRLKEGDLVLMVAIGAGLTWGSMILRL